MNGSAEIVKPGKIPVAPIEGAILEARRKNEVFNPYEKTNYEKAGLGSTLEKLEPVCIIKGQRFWTDWTLHSRNTSSIYIYKMDADIAGFWIANWSSDFFPIKGLDKNHPAVSFFGKEVWALLEPYMTEGIISSVDEIETTKIPYFSYAFGYHKNSDAHAGGSIADWFVVPREIFIDESDHTYLFLCAEKVPELKCYRFPKDRLFFWDLPVATSIYIDQKISDSKILLGAVKQYVFLKHRRRGTEEDPGVIVPCPGHFTWKSEPKIQPLKRGKALTAFTTDNYCFRYKGKDYKCPPIELCIYNTSQRRNESRAVFLWQGGNENDRIKPEYFGVPSVNDVRNKYPNIYGSLSLDTVFGSLYAFNHINMDSAARYVARTIAKQPEGYRSVSVDIEMTKLMGGVLYAIEEAALSIPTIPINKENESEDDKKERERVTSEIVGYIDSLYKINGSHLFYDSPVFYKDSDSEAAFYFRDVLGIAEGTNGCQKAHSLLSSLFKSLHFYGLDVNYFFCDIELIGNETTQLRNRRFKEAYNNAIGYKSNDYPRLYDTLLLPEVRNRADLWNNLVMRGYAFDEGFVLKDVGQAREIEGNNYPQTGKEPDGNPKAEFYYGVVRGVTNDKRRNPNVWDAVMKEYVNGLYYKYIIEPVVKYNPKAKCSVTSQYNAKGYINWADRLETYLGGSVRINENMYSCVGTYGGASQGYKKHSMDSWKMFPNIPTPFTVIKEGLQCIRAIRNASDNRFTVFVPSWNFWATPLNKVRHFLEYKKDSNNKPTDEIERIDHSYVEVMRSYYRESVYHTILNCPSAIATYFSTDPKKNDGENAEFYIRISGKKGHGNVKSIADKEDYYIDSCDVMTEILSEINRAVGEEKGVPLINTQIDDASSFVISGVEIGKKRVWRISFDSEIKTPVKADFGKEGAEFTVNGKRIVFANGEKVGSDNTDYGYWIKTPVCVMPVITTEDQQYYKSNPAFSSNKLEAFALEKRGWDIRYRYLNSHTLFGYVPRSRLISFRFRINKPLESYANIFVRSASKNMSCPDETLIQMGPVNTEYPNNNGSISVRIYKDQKVYKKGYLEIGKSYEAQMRIEQERVSNPKEPTLFTYTILGFSDEEGKPFTIQFVPSNAADFTEYLTHSVITVLQPGVSNIMDYITIEDFRIYFDKALERIEIFRESDGVNVGQVNQQNPAYKRLPVETRSDDQLVGRFSWLNATDRPVSYRITFMRDKKAVSRLRNQFKVVHAPDNGTVTDFNCFCTTGQFTVAPNSEGNLLFCLPEVSKNTSEVALKLESVRREFSRDINFDEGKLTGVRPVGKMVRETLSTVTVPIN